MQFTLEIPDETVSALGTTPAELPTVVLQAIALEAYRSERLSEWQVCQLLGFQSRLRLHAFLKERGVPMAYSREDLEHDRAMAREFAAHAPELQTR